jgi:hypothetical protein
MVDRYDLPTARGGKDDAAIEEALRGKWDALRPGDTDRSLFAPPFALDRQGPSGHSVGPCRFSEPK